MSAPEKVSACLRVWERKVSTRRRMISTSARTGIKTVKNMNYLDNKNYRDALEYMASHDLSALTAGKHIINGDELFLNICDSDLKTSSQARFEAHRKYIDIQVPLSGEESFGVMPVAQCRQQDGEFDTEKDIVFFNDPVAASTIFTAQPGQVVVFGPDDAHAPLIGEGRVHKAIFKVKL